MMFTRVNTHHVTAARLILATLLVGTSGCKSDITKNAETWIIEDESAEYFEREGVIYGSFRPRNYHIERQFNEWPAPSYFPNAAGFFDYYPLRNMQHNATLFQSTQTILDSQIKYDLDRSTPPYEYEHMLSISPSDWYNPSIEQENHLRRQLNILYKDSNQFEDIEGSVYRPDIYAFSYIKLRGTRRIQERRGEQHERFEFDTIESDPCMTAWLSRGHAVPWHEQMCVLHWPAGRPVHEKPEFYRIHQWGDFAFERDEPTFVIGHGQHIPIDYNARFMTSLQSSTADATQVPVQLSFAGSLRGRLYEAIYEAHRPLYRYTAADDAAFGPVTIKTATQTVTLNTTQDAQSWLAPCGFKEHDTAYPYELVREEGYLCASIWTEVDPVHGQWHIWGASPDLKDQVAEGAFGKKGS